MYGAAWKLGARMPAPRPLQRAIFTRIHATTFVELTSNEDTRTGGWRRLKLQAAPFFFPEPIETIGDIPTTGSAPDKRLGLWELASM